MALITVTPKGLYCAAGDFFIDPWKPVKHAIITHAHSDHARPGSENYLCHNKCVPLLQQRLGNIAITGIAYNKTIYKNQVAVTLFPAGHMVGSAQVKVEYKGEIWVVSGDYKTMPDGICEAFEPINCHTFITESTFGLPIYKWQSQEIIYKQITDWICNNHKQEISSILFAYSLGKAQRIINALGHLQLPIYAHGAIYNAHEAIKLTGTVLPEIIKVSNETNKQKLKSAIVIAPLSAINTPWLKQFAPYKTAICSGWMQVRGNKRRENADIGFALSDHADWNGLLSAIKATNANNVLVTHGFKASLARYLNENGINAAELETFYGNEEEFAI